MSPDGYHTSTVSAEVCQQRLAVMTDDASESVADTVATTSLMARNRDGAAVAQLLAEQLPE